MLYSKSSRKSLVAPTCRFLAECLTTPDGSQNFKRARPRSQSNDGLWSWTKLFAWCLHSHLCVCNCHGELCSRVLLACLQESLTIQPEAIQQLPNGLASSHGNFPGAHWLQLDSGCPFEGWMASRRCRLLLGYVLFAVLWDNDRDDNSGDVRWKVYRHVLSVLLPTTDRLSQNHGSGWVHCGALSCTRQSSSPVEHRRTDKAAHSCVFVLAYVAQLQRNSRGTRVCL